jgi:glycosyltransferase involved in cell wall biosynthesis
MLADPGKGHVLHASWVDEEMVIDRGRAGLVWDRKENSNPLTLLFAGRLIHEKGLDDLLKAIEDLSSIHLDVIGNGELEPLVSAIASTTGKVRLLEPIPYGPRFFELLRSYHAIVVPSRTDEQPRIVYDAFSQAIPVIGTETAGLKACVAHEQTGLLVPLGDVVALREAIERARRDRIELRRMGLSGLEIASRFTHREMHTRRRALILEKLGMLPRDP